MKPRPSKPRRAGTATLEFAFVAIPLLLIMLAGIEIDRMMLVYTTLANAAREGQRYAIVHGNNRTGSGEHGPSGPGNNPPEVVTVVKNFASAGVLAKSKVSVTVMYPNGNNDSGSPVRVIVAYPYDPFTVLPLGVTLSATSHGIIAF